MVGSHYGSICRLVGVQSYISNCFPDPTWVVQDTAPASPRVPAWPAAEIADFGGYDLILHLGYRGWPLPDVCRHTLETANKELEPYGVFPPLKEAELCLNEPWIAGKTALDRDASTIVYGFTDEYFELKFGLVTLLGRNFLLQPVGNSPRWNATGQHSLDWAESLMFLQSAGVFLGDCSALHVLAVACGIPVVLMEPQPMRHNAVFYPLGDSGPQVWLVRGLDGKPTWDARHVKDAIVHALTRNQAA
jgi:hypothetical protein